MARVSGTEGSVTFASGYAATLNTWSVNAEGQSLDATAFGDPWDRKVGGRKSWSGAFSGVWESSSTTDGALAGAAAAATFKFKSSAGTITGNIIITGIDYTVSIDAANQIAFTFDGDGTMAVTESGV
jgi:predicted secreted protein